MIQGNIPWLQTFSPDALLETSDELMPLDSADSYTQTENDSITNEIIDFDEIYNNEIFFLI